MSTLQETAALIARLNGSAVKAAADGKKREQRAARMGELMNQGFPDSARAALRETMVFSVMSKDGKTEIKSTDLKEGSRKAIETEDSKKYQALSAKQAEALQAALERIAAVKAEMLAAVDDHGEPLFTEADLMEELFSPLVREGLLVENLVIDKHSEVAEMLAGTYASYETMLSDARKAKNEAAGKMEADLSNAGSRVDRVAALVSKGKGVADSKVGNIAGRCGLTADEAQMLGELTMSGAMLAKAPLAFIAPGIAFGNAVSGVDADPKSALDIARGVGIAAGGGTLGTGAAGVGTVLGGLDAAIAIAPDNRRLPDLQRAALAAAMVIDQNVSNALVRRFPPAAGALDGRIAAALDVNALAKLGTLDRPQAPLFCEVVTKALQQALVSVAAQAAGAKPAFDQVATVLAQAYVQRVDAKALVDAMKAATASADDAFDALTAAAAPAADAAFADGAFVAALPSLTAAFTGAAKANNEHLEADLQNASEETEAFERRLVLVDEGGDDMARQRSIAQLVYELERNRKILDMVAKVAAPFTSAGSTAGSILKAVGQAGSVVAGAGGAVTAAFSAAQLIIQMSVEIIKIAQRAQLALKFSADVDKARKAGSRMLPAIERFYNSKVAQEIFASVTVALQAVQLAGTIAAGVPEPITAATGSLIAGIGSMGQAANDFAQKTYTAAQLSSGWNATAEALNNPKNRRAGLDALHANSTLAVHAVAWAATEGDPLATQIMRSCGVNTQTLADSETDQAALVTYLETRLYEDIQFKDGDAVGAGLGWVPSPLRFSLAAWFAVLNRAKKIASPALDPRETTPAIMAAFAALDAQPTVDDMAAHLADHDPATLRAWAAQNESVTAAFEAFVPRMEDGSLHAECERIRMAFTSMSKSRHETLDGLLQRRLALAAPTAAVVPTGRKRSNAVSA